MLEDDLKEFYSICKEKLKKVLPTEQKTVEEYLFLANIHFSHFAQLVWDRSTQKTTDSYLQYLLEQIMEEVCYASELSKISFEDLSGQYEDYYGVLKSITVKEIDDLLVSTLVLNNEMVSDPLFRSVLGLKILELKRNLNLHLILDHYKNWQK